MKKLPIITLFLLGSCMQKSDKFCRYNESKITNSYILIETKTNKQVCVSFEDLTTITPFDVLDYEIGKKERAEIACGSKLIDTLELKTLSNRTNSPIFLIDKESNLVNLDSTLNLALLKNGVFDIQNYDYQTKGLLIKEAINKNIEVSFADNFGNYLWKNNFLYSSDYK